MRASRSSRSLKLACLLGGLAVVAALLLAPPAARGANTTQPNSQTQPLADGCQRNATGLLTFTSPEWVYIYKDPTPRWVLGSVTHTHTAGGDLPQGHDWYDLNSNVNVASGFNYLVSTANFTGDPSAEDYGRLHVEWETGSVPKFVWPTESDNVALLGSWIWDCGHWGASPGVTNPDLFLPGQGEAQCNGCPGERSEFHPMRAMLVVRANQSVSSSTRTEADAFISTDGTIAHAEAQCALAHPAPNPDSYGPDYSACVQDASQRYQQVNNRDYTFFVPAPRKPSSTATLTYSVKDQGVGVNSPTERVQTLGNGILVTIPFNGYGTSGQRQVYGKSFFVGWNTDPTPPTHLRVTFNSLTVVHALDPPSDTSQGSDDPGAEWNLYFDLNGSWQLVNDWAPGLGSLADGTTLQLNKTVDIYVPSGGGVRLFAHGRECDLPKIQPCPANPGEVASDNDVPGEILAQFSSPATAVGSHTAVADSGNYQLTYSVSTVP